VHEYFGHVGRFAKYSGLFADAGAFDIPETYGLHAFKETVNGAGSIPPAFGGGEANISLEEDSLAISFSHGFK
jgi:hypothetical protein